MGKASHGWHARDPLAEDGGESAASPQRRGRPEAAAAERTLRTARERRRVAVKVRVEGSSKKESPRMVAVQAAFSSSFFHCPSVARPFILARCAKALCAASTFVALPDQACCGAACSARP